MAFTYLILNLAFIIVVLLITSRWLRKPTRTWVITCIALLVLTLVFDNLMLWAGFFSYNSSLLSGAYLGLAPIEDFFYAILAAILVPILWKIFSPKHEKQKGVANV